MKKGYNEILMIPISISVFILYIQIAKNMPVWLSYYGVSFVLLLSLYYLTTMNGNLFFTKRRQTMEEFEQSEECKITMKKFPFSDKEGIYDRYKETIYGKKGRYVYIFNVSGDTYLDKDKYIETLENRLTILYVSITLVLLVAVVNFVFFIFSS